MTRSRPARPACPDAVCTTLEAELAQYVGHEPKHQDLRTLYEASTRIGMICGLYMTAWEDLGERSRRGEVPPELEDRVRYLLTLGPRSPWTIAGMTATCLCAALEDFMERRVIDSVVVAGAQTGLLRIARPTRGRLPARDFVGGPEDVRELIRNACKPSVNLDAGGWVRNSQVVFGIQPSDSAIVALTALTWMRNHFAHGGFAGEPLGVTGEELTAWRFGVLGLALSLVEAGEARQVPREDAVRARAHLLWERSGRTDGEAASHWLQAELIERGHLRA